jgi:TRAP-type C4-dicarboxylate transport system permease small subunit
MNVITSKASLLVKLQKLITVILAVSVLLIVVAQVLLRYVFKAPLMGIEELLFFPTIWLYMLGGANASQERNHIECGILTLYIKKPKSMMIFNVVKNTVSVFVGVWLLYWAYWLFSYSLNLWKTSDLLYIPMFFMEAAPFVGLVLMVFYAVLQLFDSIKLLVREGEK